MGDNGDGDWGRWRWPLGLRQPLHPAAQTAEMEIGGGGGGREEGEGSGAVRRWEEQQPESWERGDGGGAAGEQS